MSDVYVVLQNFPYEFGRVAGVFGSEADAICHACRLEDQTEVEVQKWALGGGSEVVWEMLCGEVQAPIDTTPEIPNAPS